MSHTISQAVRTRVSMVQCLYMTSRHMYVSPRAEIMVVFPVLR